MYKMVPWSAGLDLSDFYKSAEEKGFVNNANQKLLVDAFNSEREKQVWIFYYNSIACGSVAAHSFDDVMGLNSYRIGCRLCTLTDKIPISHVRTFNEIKNNQSITGQFLLPTCVEWVPTGSRLYITTTKNLVGKQHLVHRICGDALSKSGQIARVKDIFYRGSEQTVWEFFPEKMWEILSKFPRWC
jgi:hypothetical protein